MNLKLKQEKEILTQIVCLYCHKKHKYSELCPDCKELLDYAKKRSESCPYKKTKSFCSNCKNPCYRKDMREKIRKVMKFSGPRMIFYHPVIVIRHIKKSLEKRMEERI
ncbi:MAG: nitrous oxide-stimulated promoter family protein [Christensenellaceae bacterium]|nr:nitrous oxide-stimulated promoter family protein [Christensenellaceae bacterium]